MLATMCTLAGTLGITGCEFVYLHYSDCQYYEGPRFDRNFLLQPVLNQQYSDQVSVFFDGDGHIDDYDYRLEFSGSLPPGISYYPQRSSIRFEGAAISQGTYSFTIAVVARYEISDRLYYFNDANCHYRTTQRFLLTVDSV